MSITPGIVTFSPAAFTAVYPCFMTVPDAALNANFAAAELLLNNSYCSVVEDAPTRAQLLNLLTAHITALFNGVGGQPPSGVVGRITNASQGSVSVGVELKADSETASWLAQTNWGFLFWTATLRFRTARVVTVREAWCGGGFGDGWPE